MNRIDGNLTARIGGLLMAGFMLVGVCGSSFYAAQSPKSSGPAGRKIEAELIKAENEMMEAFKRGDAATLEKIVAEEYVLTSATSRGEYINKRQYIDGGPQQIKVEQFRFHDFKITLLGEVAIVVNRLEWKSTWNGKVWNADFLMTDAWVKRAGRWQIVNRHSSYPDQYRPQGN